jgi:hypothetical protein
MEADFSFVKTMIIFAQSLNIIAMRFKWFFNIIVAATCSVAFVAAGPVCDCKFKNTPLYGNVKVVEHYADFDVKVVKYHADLHVKEVRYHADKCGEWHFVNHYEDFTIRYVEHYEDFTIKFVSFHPGTP